MFTKNVVLYFEGTVRGRRCVKSRSKIDTVVREFGLANESVRDLH